MTRIGQKQLRLLIMTASPTMLLLTTDKVSESLVKRGLMREEKPGGACGITPAGLRVLAEEMLAGRVKDAIEAMKAESRRRQARKSMEAAE